MDLLVQFSVDGDLAYLSHLDGVRLTERLLRRAGWPLRFSEGFHVRPRLSLLLPRPVGVTSDDERLRVGLTDAAGDLADLSGRLAAVLPAGLTLRAVRPAGPRAAERIVAVEYLATLPQGRTVPTEAVEAVLGAASLPMRRQTDARGGSKQVDIRPFVQAVAASGRRVRMRLAVTDGGTARPWEVLAALGVEPEAAAGASVHRAALFSAAEQETAPVARPATRAGDETQGPEGPTARNAHGR
jgi:radical SAM-linked protein